MIRYYLIPFDLENPDYQDGCCPKYLDQLGIVSGTTSLEIAADGNGNKQWKVAHYIVRLERGTEVEFPELPADCWLIDAARLTHASTINFLSGLGVTIPKKPTSDQVERAVGEWLGHGPRTIAELRPD